VVRRDQAKKIRGKEVVIETHYSEFKPLKGVMLPRRIRTIFQGTVLNDTKITDIEANPKLPKNFFSPPVPGWPEL
jgi:hypothetical protein